MGDYSVATSKIDFQSRGFSPLRLRSTSVPRQATLRFNNDQIERRWKEREKREERGGKRKRERKIGRKKWGFSETDHCARRRVALSTRKVENKRDNFDMCAEKTATAVIEATGSISQFKSSIKHKFRGKSHFPIKQQEFFNTWYWIFSIRYNCNKQKIYFYKHCNLFIDAF